MRAIKPGKRSASDDELRALKFRCGEQINEWLDDKVLFVFDSFAQEFPGKSTTAKPG